MEKRQESRRPHSVGATEGDEGHARIYRTGREIDVGEARQSMKGRDLTLSSGVRGSSPTWKERVGAYAVHRIRGGPHLFK